MYVCVARNGEMLVFFPFFPNNSLNRQLSFRVEVLKHLAWYLGHKGMLCFFLRFCAFFKKIHISLEEKRKNVSFIRVYVCVKAKLTFVSFFSFIFFTPFPKWRSVTDISQSDWFGLTFGWFVCRVSIFVCHVSIFVGCVSIFYCCVSIFVCRVSIFTPRYVMRWCIHWW